MHLKKILILAWSTFAAATSIAQDQSSFSQFYLNPFLLNPASAGLDGQSAASLFYRKQWADIEGAPTITNFNLHTPVDEKNSVGLSVTNDKKGMFNNSSLLVSYAHNIQLKKEVFLRFGASIGGTWNVVDTKLLEGINDPAVADIMDNSASVNGNAGLLLKARLFQIGVAIPSMFAPSYVSRSAFGVNEIKPFQAILLHSSHRFYFNNDKHIFEPYLIYRLNNGLPSQLEATGIFHINHIVWAGGSYKQDFGMSAHAGLKLKGMFAVGASYSFKNAGANQINSPSYELSLSYLFGRHKKGSVIYSFVHTEKPKQPHVSASAAIAAKKKSNSGTPHANVPVTKTPVVKNPPRQEVVKVPVEEKKEPVAQIKEPVLARRDTVEHNAPFEPTPPPPAVNIPEGHHEHEQEQISRLTIHADDHDHPHESEEEHPHAERHEFVRRGGHESELPVSDYVIGGVFGKEANAKHFSEGLDKLGYSTHYGHLTAKNLWYVYLIQTEDLEEAKAARDKFRKTKMLRDCWLLTVHH